MKTSIVFGFSICVFFIVVPSGRAQWTKQGANPPYRIGIIDYDGSTKTRSSDISKAFSILTPTQKVVFASGTAEEVLDWVSEGLVDIAILTPGAFSATIALLTDEDKQDAYRIAKKTGKPRPWDCQ